MAVLVGGEVAFGDPRKELTISSERVRGWDRPRRFGLVDCYDVGLLRAFAYLIDEGLVVQEGVKKHTRYRLHGVAL